MDREVCWSNAACADSPYGLIARHSKQLRNFANASRQLGSSVGILSSAFHLRERLAQVLYLFRENAADLFPRKVSRQKIEQPPSSIDGARRKRKRSAKHGAPHVARPIILEEHDAEEFPNQLEMLAKDVQTFLKSLNEFPEFTDEVVNNSINSFEADLNVSFQTTRSPNFLTVM